MWAWELAERDKHKTRNKYRLDHRCCPSCQSVIAFEEIIAMQTMKCVSCDWEGYQMLLVAELVEEVPLAVNEHGQVPEAEPAILVPSKANEPIEPPKTDHVTEIGLVPRIAKLRGRPASIKPKYRFELVSCTGFGGWRIVSVDL